MKAITLTIALILSAMFVFAAPVPSPHYSDQVTVAITTAQTINLYKDGDSTHGYVNATKFKLCNTGETNTFFVRWDVDATTGIVKDATTAPHTDFNSVPVYPNGCFSETLKNGTIRQLSVIAASGSTTADIYAE